MAEREQEQAKGISADLWPLVRYVQRLVAGAIVGRSAEQNLNNPAAAFPFPRHFAFEKGSLSFLPTTRTRGAESASKIMRSAWLPVPAGTTVMQLRSGDPAEAWLLPAMATHILPPQPTHCAVSSWTLSSLVIDARPILFARYLARSTCALLTPPSKTCLPEVLGRSTHPPLGNTAFLCNISRSMYVHAATLW